MILITLPYMYCRWFAKVGCFLSSVLYVARSLLLQTLLRTTCLFIKKALLPWTVQSVVGNSESLEAISNTRLTVNRPPVYHVPGVMRNSPPKNNLGDTAKTMLGRGFIATSVTRPSRIAMDSPNTRNPTRTKGTDS